MSTIRLNRMMLEARQPESSDRYMHFLNEQISGFGKSK